MAVSSHLCPSWGERALGAWSCCSQSCPFPGIHLPGAHPLCWGQLCAATKMKRSPLLLTRADQTSEPLCNRHSPEQAGGATDASLPEKGNASPSTGARRCLSNQRRQCPLTLPAPQPDGQEARLAPQRKSLQDEGCACKASPRSRAAPR